MIDRHARVGAFANLRQLAFRSRFPETRGIAIGSLDRETARSLEPEFLKAFPAEADPFVKARILEALAISRGPEATELLTAELLGADPIAPGVICAALERAGDGALPLLSVALRKGSREVRGSVAVTLGNMGSKAALALLSDLLSDEDAFIRRMAAVRLAAAGDPRAIRAVREACTADQTLRERLQCDPTRQNFEEVQHAPGLLCGWLDQLSKLPSAPGFVDVFRRAAMSPDAAVRRCALVAAGWLPGPASRPLALQLLKDEDDAVRVQAAILVRGGNDGLATEVLRAAAESSDSHTSSMAFAELLRRSALRPAQCDDAIAHGQSVELVRTAIRCEVDVNHKESFDLLASVLSRADSLTAIDAAEAMVSLDPVRAREAFKALLQTNGAWGKARVIGAAELLLE